MTTTTEAMTPEGADFALRVALEALPDNRPLAEGVLETAFEAILAGKADPLHVAALLMGLKVRGENSDDILAAARVLRRHASGFQAPFALSDTCGTGGDGLDTYNISTASAFVTAACGVKVAKHGNRSVSSKSGSSDVLLALGANLDVSTDDHLDSLERFNFSFLFAPKHHAAMRHVAPIRASLKTRTIFNLLGPLANPASASFQVLGVFDRAWLEPMAKAADALGAQRVWVVHGADGLDELSISGPTFVTESNKGVLKSFTVTPEDAGLDRYNLSDLKGGDAHHNADAMRDMFAGGHPAYRASVVLNTAASLVVAGNAPSLMEAADQAQEAITSGKVTRLLDEWVAFTQTRKPTDGEG